VDRKLDNILNSYTVADADKDFLERVMLRVKVQQNVTSLRRQTYVYALMFMGVLMSGIWAGNISAGRTILQTQEAVATQYKYLAQITFGSVSFDDFLL
jgi:hypothetical protein